MPFPKRTDIPPHDAEAHLSVAGVGRVRLSLFYIAARYVGLSGAEIVRGFIDTFISDTFDKMAANTGANAGDMREMLAAYDNAKTLGLIPKNGVSRWRIRHES